MNEKKSLLLQKGYWEDGARLEFSGTVRAVFETQAGRAVRFEKTYFYPESGGQLADGGTAGGEVVLDVQQDDQGPYVVLARGVHINSGDIVECSVDAEKRLRHTQLHSAQHILSRLLDDTGIQTLSFHMTEDQASIEIDVPTLSEEHISELEDAVERIACKCLPVQTLLVDAADLSAFHVRKVPELAGGPLRLVCIGDLDTNPCGGTHVMSTGEIGSFVITGSDRVRGNLRLYFAAGRTATAYRRKEHQVLEQARQLLTCGIDDVVPAVERLQKRDRDLGRQVKNLLAMAADETAHRILERISGPGAIAAVLDGVPAEFGRLVAARMGLVQNPFCIVIYPSGSADGQLLCIVPAGYEQLLDSFGSEMKERYAARIGGSGRTLQGSIVGRVTESQLESLLHMA